MAIVPKRPRPRASKLCVLSSDSCAARALADWSGDDIVVVGDVIGGDVIGVDDTGGAALCVCGTFGVDVKLPMRILPYEFRYVADVFALGAALPNGDKAATASG